MPLSTIDSAIQPFSHRETILIAVLHLQKVCLKTHRFWYSQISPVVLEHFFGT